MKRRSFLQMLAALAGLPFLPKAAAKPALNLVASCQGVVGLQGPVGAAGPHLGPAVGNIMPYVGTEVPAGWLPCDGREVPADYQKLKEILPFKLPDLRGRELVKNSAAQVQYIIKA